MLGRRLGYGFAVGLLTSLPLLALFQLGAAVADLPVVPYDLFEWMTHWLPGRVITFGIDAIVTLVSALHVGATSVAAKTAEKVLAILQFCVAAGVVGACIAAVRAPARQRAAGLAAGLVAWLGSLVVVSWRSGGQSANSGAWLAILCLGWGYALGVLLSRQSDGAIAPRSARDRRRALALLAGSAGAIAAVVSGLAGWLRRRAGRNAEPGFAEVTSQRGVPAVAPDAAPIVGAPDAAALAARPQPAPGTRPELTPNDRFYRIDINLEPPAIDERTWRLHVEGLVDEPLVLSLADIRALPAITQTITLECISNRVGGDLIGTSRWTGVRLKDVLHMAAARANARAVHVQAADGFYESVGFEDLQDDRTMLVYAMNGELLPRAHGFPLRIYIPNRHGMKQPKWITRLIVSDRDGPGFWVDRGWSKDAIPHTTSVIDTVGMSMMVGKTEFLAVGGIAYAGARGIQRVEISVDDGPWTEAQTLAPALSPLTWVLWRYEWPYRAGRHIFRVRAYDGSGALQTAIPHGPRPDGATGIHTLTVDV